MRVTAAKEWSKREGVTLVTMPARADSTPVTPPEPAIAIAAHAPGAGEERRASWPASRIAAVEALWGEGFTMPGGGPETMRLAKPFGLSSSATLLLLGGGLGGPAASISNGFGAWVASFEADPQLRAMAEARLPALDPHHRITSACWDRAQPSFRRRSANHVLALEALRGNKPWPVLESLAGALRPQGQIVLTELVCEAAPAEKDREFSAWCRLENRLPELPSPQEVTNALQRLRFDVRVVEDMSDRHITQTLGGWRDAVKAMAAGPRPTAHTAAAFVTEAELWLLRIRLMRRLGVRLMRWHAISGTASA
jgi:cyclopropane fatty-acyl-phospholipid synthase-like methyltransferase